VEVDDLGADPSARIVSTDLNGCGTGAQTEDIDDTTTYNRPMCFIKVLSIRIMGVRR